MKSVRFYITEKCNARCNNCFNRNERNNSQMDIEKFEELCFFFSTNGYELIKVMGGEPTMHPQFKEMMKITQNLFPKVSLFTNGMDNALLDFSPRETDCVVYNFKFNHVLNEEKLLLSKPGKRSIEIQVSKKKDCNSLLDDIIRISDLSNRTIFPYLTLDCTADIFTEREIVIPIYERIWEACKDLGLIVGQDHIAPLCYVRGSKIPIPKNGAMCHVDCAGLIDANYNIRFCNQYSDVLANIYKSNNKLMSIQEYEALLAQKFSQIQNKAKDKGCGSCPMYNIFCNGGCFASKDYIYPQWNTN